MQKIDTVTIGMYDKPIFDRSEAELAADIRTARRIVEDHGMVVCDDEEAAAQLCTILKPMYSFFAEEIVRASLVYVYCFNMDDQTDTEDGKAHTYFETDNGRGINAIGIATDVLDDPDYVRLLFMHELAHLLEPWDGELEHGADFMRMLDGLIGRWNKATGSHIVNDAKPNNKAFRQDAQAVNVVLGRLADIPEERFDAAPAASTKRQFRCG